MHSYENPAMSYECDLTAERDALKAENAELRAALEYALPVLEASLRDAREQQLDVYAVRDARQRVEQARAALAKVGK